MAATGVVRSSTRVAMVWPHSAMVQRDVVDLRAEPDENAELVDQAHFGERVRILAAHEMWRYVQGEDHYLGWLPERTVPPMSSYGKQHVVAVLLAEVHELADESSAVIARLPAGTRIPILGRGRIDDGTRVREFEIEEPAGWRGVAFSLDEPRRGREGFVAIADLADIAELSHAYPTPADLLATADAFIGVPYLWGGTTARGLDCSGFVQQVYRLNGVALPRDADQQAMLGQRVGEARAGDLLFFGEDSVTHVAIATSAGEFVHAPMLGGLVERGRLGGDRKLRAIRRYLPAEGTP